MFELSVDDELVLLVVVIEFVDAFLRISGVVEVVAKPFGTTVIAGIMNNFDFVVRDRHVKHTVVSGHLSPTFVWNWGQLGIWPRRVAAARGA